MRNIAKLTMAGGAFAVAAMVTTLSTTTSECQWQSHMDVHAATSISIANQPPVCDADVTEVSWFSWLAGKSASYQFHFIDLLELLYSNDSRSGQFGASQG